MHPLIAVTEKLLNRVNLHSKICANWQLKNGEPAIISGKQELYEAIINMYI